MSPTAAQRPPAPVPPRPTPRKLQQAVRSCHACDLWEGATQAVLGEGAGPARLMLVGEQPGDREDIEGHPFVPGRPGARPRAGAGRDPAR